MSRYKTKVRYVDAIQFRPSLNDKIKADWGLCMAEGCVHQAQDEHIHNPSHILFPKSGQWILRFKSIFEVMTDDDFQAMYEAAK